MAPLQKEIYRSLLSKHLRYIDVVSTRPHPLAGQNFEILQSLSEPNASSSKGNVTKTNMNNLLMQLRKYVV